MFFKNKSRNYSQCTEYNPEMMTKRNNYTFLNQKYSVENQTVLLGDSITDFFNWYELFYDFSKVSGQAVYNRGISGDTTDRLLERLYDNVLSIKPRNLVILIGTNDMNRNVPHSATIENMESIIRETKKACPDVNLIIEAVYPINEKMRHRSDKRSNKKIGNINNEYSRLCEKYDCVWLDFTNQLRDDKGNLKSEYTFDGLHINAQAYEVVARNVIPLLK